MAAEVPDQPGTPGGLSFQHIHMNDSYAKTDLILTFCFKLLDWCKWNLRSHCLIFDVLFPVALSQEIDATLSDVFAKSVEDVDVELSG